MWELSIASYWPTSSSISCDHLVFFLLPFLTIRRNNGGFIRPRGAWNWVINNGEEKPSNVACPLWMFQKRASKNVNVLWIIQPEGFAQLLNKFGHLSGLFLSGKWGHLQIINLTGMEMHLFKVKDKINIWSVNTCYVICLFPVQCAGGKMFSLFVFLSFYSSLREEGVK